MTIRNVELLGADCGGAAEMFPLCGTWYRLRVVYVAESKCIPPAMGLFGLLKIFHCTQWMRAQQCLNCYFNDILK